MKRIICSLICSMLLLFSTFSFSAAFNESNIIYVDDDDGADYTSIQNAENGFNRNVSGHVFCVVNLGNAQLMNFQGRFNSIPVHTDLGTRYFGFGTFQFDLVKQNDKDGSLLNICQFHRQSAYFQNITVRATTFIGWYQPTSNLSIGELSGFALKLKINPLYS